MTSGKGVDDSINTLIQKNVLKKGLFNYGQDIVMAFSPPVVGCLVKKRGCHGHPRTPPPGNADELNHYLHRHKEIFI